MANPTTNYGWPMPTATDLVTDLPADFAAFGQPVDTSLKALNPETTLGDIAYRSSTSNTNTRLGIGTNGQVLAVASGVPAWTTTADVTPLTTKGDVFTFSTVDARIGVGANNTVLTADSAEATGLKWATPASGAFAGCSVYKSSSQSTNSGTATAVTFDTELFDTDGYHSIVTNTERLTVPAGKAGYYLFTGSIQWTTGLTGYRYIYLMLNGSTVAAMAFAIVDNAGYPTPQNTIILYLSVGDYVSVQAEQTSGAALTVRGNRGATMMSLGYLGA